jgi:hypothetical protein
MSFAAQLTGVIVEMASHHLSRRPLERGVDDGTRIEDVAAPGAETTTRWRVLW